MSTTNTTPSKAAKSPQPPRISVSLKSRKRLFLSQRQGSHKNPPPVESSHASGDSGTRNLLVSQETFFTAAASKSLTIDAAAATQGSFLLAPVADGHATYPQGVVSHRSHNSLFSRIDSMHTRTDESHVQISSRQQHYSGASTNNLRHEDATTTASNITSPSFFGTVMLRSAIKADHTFESRLGDSRQDASGLNKDMDDEATSSYLMNPSLYKTDKSASKSNTSKDASLLSSSPEKNISSKNPSTHSASSSSFLTPTGKRKRLEQTLLDTPRRSILRDFGTAASHAGSKTVNWDLQQQQQHPTTPKSAYAKNAISSTSPFSKNSPGGHSLWKVLQSFKTQDDDLNERTNASTKAVIHKKESLPVDAQIEEEEEWVEVPLSLSSCLFASEHGSAHRTMDSQAQYIDWTLKRSMTFECYPCLPGKTNPNHNPVGMWNESQLDFLATQFFLPHGDISRIQTSFSQDETSLARWKASCMYWQHPHTHPLPISILEQGASNTIHGPAAKSGGNKGTFSQQTGQLLSATDLQKKCRLAGVGCLGGLGQSSLEDSTQASISRLYSQRVSEWKECFQSLFLKWIDLVMQLKDSKCDSLSKLYFYAMSPGQVILFKGILNSTNTKHPMPLIVLSSTTEQTRHSLLSMGIQLRVLADENNALDILSLDTLLNLENKTKRPTSMKDSMEFLDGSQLGFSRQHVVDKSQKRLAPIYILGPKDCMCFYEYFLNTLGGQLSHSRFQTRYTHKICDVPLLLCRSLGPCLHMALKSLSVSSKYADETPNIKHASLTLTGPILPCAVNDLICASVHDLIRDKRNGPVCSHKNEQENDVGSHYFVAHLQCHEGEEVKDTSKGLSKSNRLGMAGLVLANDGLDELNDSTMMHCSRGAFVDTVVWDITRSSSIMCKRDKK